MHRRLILPALIAAVGTAGVTAQPPASPVILPTSPFWQSTNEPFAGAAPKRYQQWFSAQSWITAVGRPVRVVGMDLIAGGPGGQPGATIDVEITMANGPTNFPFSQMDLNLQSGTTVVVPRGLQTLNNAIPGSNPLQLSFKQYNTEFHWDGTSGVVVDIKMWDNGRGNTAKPYDLQASFSSFGQVQRMWGFGPDPRFVNNATVNQPNSGLALQFSFEDGISVPFGDGCPGAGGFVPVASTSGGLPLPANSLWTQTLSNANSQMAATLILGVSRSQYLGFNLPLNLAPFAPQCELLTDLSFTYNVNTVGGGPGSGFASVNIPIPAVTVYAGQSLYTQWLYLDPSSTATAGFALSSALHSQVDV